MSLFETSPIPGAPYLLGCFFSLFAFLHCFELPYESAEYGYNYIRPYSPTNERKNDMNIDSLILESTSLIKRNDDYNYKEDEEDEQ